MIEKCPGTYCGRIDLGNETFPKLSECGACPRGYRVDSSFICAPCVQELQTYDWFYVGFMVCLPLISHFLSISICTQSRRFSKEELILHLSAFVEVALSAFSAIFFAEPKFSFKINSCGVNSLSDWYTLFHNPSPNYEQTLSCTQEAVYPLQTMILIFYLFCVTFMLIIRPGLNGRYLPQRGKMAVYYALYFFPIFSLLHTVAGGLIYYAFPYLSIIISVLSNAAHFSLKLDQSMKSLVITSVTEFRNIVIILGHWSLLAYGIISIKHFVPWFLFLVPVPAIFYIFTAKYTHPDNFK